MSFEWRDFLSLARSLEAASASPGPAEAAQRTAASRAYYAAFHCAISVGMQEGYIPHYSGEDHKRVQAHFREFRTPDADTRQAHKKVAAQLDRLLDYRRMADYIDTPTTTPRALADMALGLADTVIRTLDSLVPPG